MKKNVFLTVLVVILLPLSAHAAGSGSGEFRRIAAEVASLGLGFGDYVLGAPLNTAQKEIARKNSIEKTLPGSYKFIDGGTYVIAAVDDDTIIGLYRDYPAASREEVKNIIGELMMRFAEPTTMAHDKLIYWAYDKNGKISGDVYDFAKSSGDTDMLATVKFQSSAEILPDPEKETGATGGEEKPSAKEIKAAVSSVYVIISSNPMSKLFLALNK